MRKALFVINSLEGGGAERVFATLLASVPQRLPMAVELVLLDRFEEKYPVPACVPRHQLDARMGFGTSIRGLAGLARRERPAVIFSFLTRSNCAAVIAGLASGARVVISERVHTTSHFGTGRKAMANRLAVRALYPRADRVIAVSDGVAEDLAANYGVGRGRLAVVHNPIDWRAIAERATHPAPIPLPDRFLVAIGRLMPNKNLPMLIRAFHRAAPDCDLVILGEGPERPALTALIDELDLSGRVHLPGHVENPFAVTGRSLGYLSASNAEGFPNALVEAMALGLPVAVTDCPSGPSEILRGRLHPPVAAMSAFEAGILVPVDAVEAMAEAIRHLLDPANAARLGAAAARRARDFDVEATAERYAGVIRAALQR